MLRLKTLSRACHPRHRTLCAHKAASHAPWSRSATPFGAEETEETASSSEERRPHAPRQAEEAGANGWRSTRPIDSSLRAQAAAETDVSRLQERIPTPLNDNQAAYGSSSSATTPTESSSESAKPWRRKPSHDPISGSASSINGTTRSYIGTYSTSQQQQGSDVNNSSTASASSPSSLAANIRLWRRKTDPVSESPRSEPEKSKFNFATESPPAERLSSSGILQGAASAEAKKPAHPIAPKLFPGASSGKVAVLTSPSIGMSSIKPPLHQESFVSLIDRSSYDASGSILGKYLKDKPKESPPTLNSLAELASTPTFLRSTSSAANNSKDTASTSHQKRSQFKFHLQSDNATVLGSSIKSIFDKNLGSFARKPPEPVASRDVVETGDDASAESEDAPVSEQTEGERRYLQYQERLRIQRTKFEEKLPPSNVGDSYVKNASPEPKDTEVFSAKDFRAKLSEALNLPSDDEQKSVTVGIEKPGSKAAPQRPPVVKEISIPVAGMSVRDLASTCSMKLKDVTAKLIELGEAQEEGDLDSRVLDADVVELVVLELGFEAKREAPKRDIEARPSVASADQKLDPRAPLVSVMGHVDHGKTTLLDSLRKASVAASEAGGITQKLSAFTVPVKGRRVVFLDTPGHAAFTAMRAHGAAATDIVILVVALDDGVRPQTKEAVRVAKEAGCTIVVALNKVDKVPAGKEREAARLRVLTELLELDLVAESFGGDVQVVEVSGKTGEGVDALVEGVLLQADVLDLKAASSGMAECTVLEAYMEKGRGVVCDLLVRWGRLNVGDNVVVGTAYGKIRAMTDDAGRSLKTAGPSSAVRLLGLRAVPQAGQELITVDSDSKARMIVERRERVLELRRLRQSGDPVTGDVSGSSQIQIDVLLKADGHGTLDALQRIVAELGNRIKDVKINSVGASVGDITRSDIETASTFQNACILGFNIGLTDSVSRELAKQYDIPIYRDTVIYRLEDALRETAVKLIPKIRVLESEGRARVLKMFDFSGKDGPIHIAGVNVATGSLKSNKPGKAEFIYRVFRNGALVADEIQNAELKRFKDTVHEVESGNECGLSFDSFRDIQVGDEVECLRVDWVSKSLDLDEERETLSQAAS